MSCFYQYGGNRQNFPLRGWGDCTTCVGDENKDKCRGYICADDEEERKNICDDCKGRWRCGLAREIHKCNMFNGEKTVTAYEKTKTGKEKELQKDNQKIAQARKEEEPQPTQTNTYGKRGEEEEEFDGVGHS